MGPAVRGPLRDPEGIESPLAGYASKSLRAAVIELQLRPDDEVLDHARDEHLASTRDRADARSDVDSDTADVVLEHLALSGVQPAADGQTQAIDLRDDLLSATNRIGIRQAGRNQVGLVR
jgi:hypothetical protein